VITQQHFTTSRQRRGNSPLIAELKTLFEALPDEQLIEALQATRWTGRPGYPVRIMWRSLVASFYLGIVHDTDLIRALHANPLLAAACGIKQRQGVPSKYAYCRFRRKLVTFNDLVGKILSQCVDKLRDALPGFGATVAVDATDVKAWANGLHQETDPDAGTGAKKKSGGHHYWYGYKVHTVVDADAELPLWFLVTPANVYDGSMLPPVLQEAQMQYGWLRPKYVTADKGYDAKACFEFVGEKMGTTPVIDVQRRRATAREGRPCEAEPVITPDGIHYRCQRVPYDPACPRFGKCPLLPLFADGPLHKAVPGRYFERHSPFPYGSCQWKAVYNKRVAVERVFSRLKTYRKLDAVRTRRLPKVWLHIAMSLLVMNTVALANMTEDRSRLRQCLAAA